MLSSRSPSRFRSGQHPAVRAGIIVVLAALAFGLTAAPARAHPVLAGSQPRDGAVLQARPTEVRLTFTEPIGPFAQLRVYNDRGLRVDRGAPRTQGRVVRVALADALAPGTYVVHWRVVAADGHSGTDSFVFDYLRPTRAGVVHVGRDHSAQARGAVRFLALVLTALLIGRSLLLPGGAARRGLAAAGTLAFGALLAADAVGLSGLSLERALHPSVLRQVLHTATGHARLVQILCCGVAALAPIVAAPAAALALAVEALAGHATTAAYPLIAEVSQGAHVLAMGLWLGGLAVVLRHRAPEVLARFGRFAFGALVVLVGTGTFNGITEVETWARLWHTTYGRLLVLKVVLLGVVVVLAWLNRRGGARARLVGVELTALAVIVALGVTLGGLAPPRAGNGPIARVFTLGPWRASFDVDPARAGANEVHLFLLSAPGQLAPDVAFARVTVQHGATTSDVHLREAGRGHYVTETGAFRSWGAWRATILAQRSDGSRYVKHLRFEIAP